MRERCEDCRGMEEDIYWTHFHTMHFCLFLSGDFQSQLMIPERFSEKLGGKLGKKLCLRGPSGTTWDVELVKCGDLLCFGGGWEVFLEDHSIAENDILVFKYKGNSQFDVLIFEGGSLCERESSYFVRKCGHTKPEQEAERPETPKPSKDCCSVETVQEHSPDPVADSETETETETGDASEKRNSSSKDKGKGLKRACSDQPRFSSAEVELRGKKPSPIWETVKLPGCKQTPTREAKSPPYHLYYGANRRSEAEAKELEALKSATRELSEGSFLLAMRSTHVHKKYYLSLPQEWVTKHVTQEKQDVILRTSERSWKTTMIFNSKGRGGLSRGWRDFAADNRLKEFDVCIFKLASQMQKPIVLDVSVFRVGPEVAPPPSLSTPEPSSSRGASAPDKRKFSQLENDA